MKIRHIETLNESQKNSINSIPENLLNLLKELTIDKQMECIYVNQADRNGIEALAKSDPIANKPFKKCFNLSEWGISEVLVYDGVIVEVSDEKNRRITFGSILKEKQQVTYDEWDAHTHNVYKVSQNVEFYFQLVIFENHKYLNYK